MNIFFDMSREMVFQGLIFSLVVMGVYLTSRVIRCDDLSVEGSFGMGGAMTACFLGMGFDFATALGVSLIAGSCAGLAAGVLQAKMKINPLIAGIIVTTAAYSINLKIAGANKSLISMPNLFEEINSRFGSVGEFLILFGICALMLLGIKKLLTSEIGMLMRGAGCNPGMMAILAKDIHLYRIVTLSLANGIIGLAGGLFVQFTGFYSITGSMGILVVGLTGLIVAEMFSRSFSLALLAGAVVCQSFFTLTIALGLDPVWNYLIKAGLIVACLQFNRINPPVVWQRS